MPASVLESSASILTKCFCRPQGLNNRNGSLAPASVSENCADISTKCFSHAFQALKMTKPFSQNVGLVSETEAGTREPY